MLKETKSANIDYLLEKSLKLFGSSKENILKDLEGYESYVYEISINNRSYILKLTHNIRRNYNEIMGEIDWLNFLSENDLPVSKAIKSKHNNLIEKIEYNNGYFFAYVFEKAKGEKIKSENINDNFFINFGKIMGKLHHTTKKYIPSENIFTRPQWDKEIVFKFEETFPNYEKELLEKALKIKEKISTYSKEKDVYNLIHGDFHDGNFFVENDKLTLFDFDDSSYNWFANDISTSLYYFGKYTKEKEKDNFVNNSVDKFLEGYSSENKLNKFWLYSIPEFIKLRHCVLYSSIISNSTPEELEKKDTKELIERIKGYIEKNTPKFNFDLERFEKYFI